VPDPISATEASRVRRPGFDAEAPPVEPAERKRRLWSVLPMCAGFAVFGAVVWLAYQDASLGPPGAEPPLIRAAPEPIKLPPDQAEETSLAAEQGAVGRLWSDGEQADQPERLLPPPEQPRSPPSGEPRAGLTAGEPGTASAPGEAADENSRPGVAALPSGAPGQVSPDSTALQPSTDESLQQAEAALDRLLAEVTALPGETQAPAANSATSTGDADAPGATAAVPAQDTDVPGATVPAEDTDVPGATGAGPGEDTDTIAAPADESSTSAPAPATTAAAPSTRAAPAVPPQKPTPVAAAARSATGTEVPPAETPAAAPAADAPAPDGSTETAALSPPRLPPVVADGEFRIQLAAVRGQADARRAWDLFVADMAPVLRGIDPIFERADTTNGVFYRVQIGPFASQQSAESLCEQLKQRNASCFVIRR
jgi:cell division septation protein DedD